MPGDLGSSWTMCWPLHLGGFPTQGGKTSKSWGEGGKGKQPLSAAPRPLCPVQLIGDFNTHWHISLINHKSLQVINPLNQDLSAVSLM